VGARRSTLRRTALATATVAVVGVVLVAGLGALRLGQRSSTRAGRGDNWVAAENRREGTRAWRINHLGAPDAIEGWADRVSAAQGDQVRLFVSTSAPSFHVEAYRMGWYAGLGARLAWRSEQVPGSRQPPPQATPGTNMISTRWRPSLTVTVDPAWPPGDYLLKLVASSGQRYVPLTVRDDESRAALVVLNAVTTWQAYNLWGDHNLYRGPAASPATRSRVVSFDRPYDQAGHGAGDFLGNEYPLVQLVERLGLDVTYWTDVDLHQHPERLTAHRGLISLGHDEYWSTRMRRGAEAAREAGVNLAFLGANAIFRHIRLQPSPTGPDREEVNYKSWSAKDDPAWGTDPAEVTTEWRAAPLNDPESRLLGNLYECNPADAPGVVVEPSSWLFAGAGVRAGSVLPGLVGPEYDRVQAGAPRPDGVELLLHSPLTCRGRASFADATYYTAASGAGVFDSGTSSWVCQLNQTCADKRSSPVTGEVVTAVTENLLRAFAAGPAAHQHPSRSNLDRFHVAPSGL